MIPLEKDDGRFMLSQGNVRSDGIFLKDGGGVKLSFLGGCNEVGKVICFYMERKQRYRFP